MNVRMYGRGTTEKRRSGERVDRGTWDERVGGGTKQCNEREITTRIARSDIELITCYLYYQDFRFTLSGGGVTSRMRRTL